MHNAIEIRDLRYAYPDDQTAEHVVFEDLNLDIRQGSFVAVLGHNGCGKSTLAKHLNAILLPEGGSVTVYGLDTKQEENLLAIRQQVGMVFQNPDNQIVSNVVEEDVAFAPENLGVASEEIRRRVEQALREVHAEALADKMTHHLSGGEKRAVSIATVLSMSPDILVLDEPSANLDPASRRTLISLLRQFTHTKIIATHDLDMVMDLCTRCIVMKDGSILADAPVPDIFADRSLLEEARLEQPLSYLLMRQERQRNNSGAS